MIKDNDTAIVRTLAAEVHVLVVGKRQVTVGIARQLDWVEPDEIEPFGRVEGRAIGRHERYPVFAVGRSRATGALVRSSAHPYASPELHAKWSVLPLIVLASR